MSCVRSIRRTLLFLLVSSVFGVSALGVAFGEGRPTVNAGILSAYPAGTEIQAVVQEISDRTGLWFSIDPSLLQRRIPVRCGRMPVEKLFKTIFPRENISLVYDTDNDLVGAVVAAKGRPAVQGIDAGALFLPMAHPEHPPFQIPVSQRISKETR